MNTININDYDTVEFGNDLKMVIPKTMTIDEIYESIEAVIPVLMYGYVNRIIAEFDDETKNDLIDCWTTSSDDEKIKEVMMFFLTEALKVYKFKSNNVKCNVAFNRFCNEAFGYFKKEFNNYSDLINQKIAV